MWLTVPGGHPEPGTIIKGDKQTMASIIVERGGKLIAQGTKKDAPLSSRLMLPRDSASLAIGAAPDSLRKSAAQCWPSAD